MTSLVEEAVARLNERSRAAMPDLVEEVGRRQSVTRAQIQLAVVGLDVDMADVRRAAGPAATGTWESMVPELEAGNGEVAGEMLISALEQMFVLGALHEQIRAERERAA